MAISTKLWNMSGDQFLTNFSDVPELVPNDVVSLRMLLSIVFDKETCTDCQSIIPNVFKKVCNMLIQEFRKFRVINFAKRQVVADGHLRELGHSISILSNFQVEEGCGDRSINFNDLMMG